MALWGKTSWRSFYQFRCEVLEAAAPVRTDGIAVVILKPSLAVRAPARWLV